MLSKQKEYMHSTTVPPPEVAIEYEETQNGYILRCYALLIEDTPLLVDGLAVEWLDQYGTLLSSDGKRQVGYTSDGGVYTVEHHQNGCVSILNLYMIVCL